MPIICFRSGLRDMPAQQPALKFYSSPAGMTTIPESTLPLDDLPGEVPGLVRIVQGLLLHASWSAAYGVSLSPERSDERHLRTAAQMLHRIRMLGDRPLPASRPASARLIGVCRHFTVLLIVLLRAKGIPARGRCGFATYFQVGRFVDHWVCEYWKAPEARWVLVDAQLDDLQQEKLRVDFSPLDVPRDRFLVAGDAWELCRNGKADPSAFGIHDMSGLWFIAGSLMRDLAALNNMEMLPWDDWGAMPRPAWSPTGGWLALFDRVAAQTRTPDATFAEMRETYADERLRVPPTVFNALRQRPEVI
jgi:hypothetical protein